MQKDRTLVPRHGTCSYIFIYNNAVANSVMLLMTWFLHIHFKIKHKLYIASGSVPKPPPQWKILVAHLTGIIHMLLHLAGIIHMFYTWLELYTYLLYVTGIMHIPFAPDWNYTHTFCTWLELCTLLLHLTGIIHIPFAPDWNYTHNFCTWLKLD
jgi:hypothetical protein